MKITKKGIVNEIIDTNGDLIGADAIPKNGSNLETQANGQTDTNAKVGVQPFRYDMLGRFGFTLMPFMEGVEDEVNDKLIDDLAKLMYDKYMETLKYYYKNPNKLKSDYRINSKSDFDNQEDEKKMIDYGWAEKILGIIQPYLEDGGNKSQTIDEAKVVEDKVMDKKNQEEFSTTKKDNEVLDKKLEKIADIINKLDDKDVDKLFKLVENLE